MNLRCHFAALTIASCTGGDARKRFGQTLRSNHWQLPNGCGDKHPTNVMALGSRHSQRLAAGSPLHQTRRTSRNARMIKQTQSPPTRDDIVPPIPSQSAECSEEYWSDHDRREAKVSL